MTEDGVTPRGASPGRRSRRAHEDGRHSGIRRLSFVRLVSQTDKRLSEMSGTDTEFLSYWGITKEEEVGVALWIVHCVKVFTSWTQ